MRLTGWQGTGIISSALAPAAIQLGHTFVTDIPAYPQHGGGAAQCLPSQWMRKS